MFSYHGSRQRLSPRGQRHAILASPLRELTGFVLVVDCQGRSVVASEHMR